MAHSVEMPELGESVTEGTITTWLKEVGDTVEVDEPLLEVSTDKVDTEIPSPVAGVLLEIKAEEDDTVEVGEVIAIVGEEGEDADSGKDDKAAEEDASDDADESEESEEKKDEEPKKKSGGSGSATDVEMPELGESVTEGTITTWLKEVGDEVEVDEPLLEVSTDKVDTEIPSPVAGTLVEILAEEDDTVEVGEVIARIGDADAGASDQKDEKEEDRDVPSEEAIEEAESKDENDTVDEAAKHEPKKSGGSGSATDVEMPELGESVTEGTITTWLKEVGDEVEVDEPLLEVSTDKVDTEIPSPVAGTLVEILAEEDDTVEVGEVIARIGDADAADAGASDQKDEKDEKKDKSNKKEKAEEKAEAPAKEEDADASDKKAEKKEEPKQAASSEKVNNSGNVPYVTPLVRKLADKHGVDLNSVEGTGVGGRIRKQDVLAAAKGDSAAAESADAPKSEQKAAPKGARSNWSTKSVDPEKAELIGII